MCMLASWSRSVLKFKLPSILLLHSATNSRCTFSYFSLSSHLHIAPTHRAISKMKRFRTRRSSASPQKEVHLISYPTRPRHDVHVVSDAASVTGLKGLPRDLESSLLMQLNSGPTKRSGHSTNHQGALSYPNIFSPRSRPSFPSPRTLSSREAPDRQFSRVQVGDFMDRTGNSTHLESADIENIPPIRPISFAQNGNIPAKTLPKPWEKKESFKSMASHESTLMMAQLLSKTEKESGKAKHGSSCEVSRPSLDSIPLNLNLSPLPIPDRVLMPLPIGNARNKKGHPSSNPKYGKIDSRSINSSASNSSSRPPSALTKSIYQNAKHPTVPDSMRISSRFINRVCADLPRMSLVPDDPIYIRDTDPNTVFKLLEKIGAGGSGTVYRATNRDGKPVAIKIVRPENRVESDALEMEIRMMNCTRHPNLIKCYETYEHTGSLWIVMELMEGGNLAAVLHKLKRKNKLMEEPQIAFILREVLKGLQFMHKLKRIHRDIKSDNILLSNGAVKLADFGFCAQLTDKEAHRNSVVGTPYWMAPELFCDEGYDYNVDLWSVGILAIECAKWVPPLIEHGPMEALSIICENEQPPSLEDPEGIWSDKFHNFVNTVLVKNPKERPSVGKLLEHEFLQKSAQHLETN